MQSAHWPANRYRVKEVFLADTAQRVRQGPKNLDRPSSKCLMFPPEQQAEMKRRIVALLP